MFLRILAMATFVSWYRKAGVSNRPPIRLCYAARGHVRELCTLLYKVRSNSVVEIFARAARRTGPHKHLWPVADSGHPFPGNKSSSWKFSFVNLIGDAEFIIFIAAARMIKLHGTVHAAWLSYVHVTSVWSAGQSYRAVKVTLFCCFTCIQIT
jgi:hypothetical protein